jgi:hypothetical protein
MNVMAVPSLKANVVADAAEERAGTAARRRNER